MSSSLALLGVASLFTPCAFGVLDLKNVFGWGPISWNQKCAKILYPKSPVPPGFPFVTGDLLNLLVVFFKDVQTPQQTALLNCIFSLFASGVVSAMATAGRQAHARSRRGKQRHGPTMATIAAAFFPSLAQFFSAALLFPTTFRASLNDTEEDGDLEEEEIDPGFGLVTTATGLVFAYETFHYQKAIQQGGSAGPAADAVKRFLIAPILPPLGLLLLPNKPLDFGIEGNKLIRKALFGMNLALVALNLVSHMRIFREVYAAGGPHRLIKDHFFSNAATAFLMFDFLSSFLSSAIWFGASQERSASKESWVWGVFRFVQAGLLVGPGAVISLWEAGKGK